MVVVQSLALLHDIGFDVMDDPHRGVGKAAEKFLHTSLQALRKEGKDIDDTLLWPEVGMGGGRAGSIHGLHGKSIPS